VGKHALLGGRIFLVAHVSRFSHVLYLANRGLA